MSVLQVHSNKIAIKGILFDKDGTLVDFLHTWGYWVELMLDHFSTGLRNDNFAPLSDSIYTALGVKGNEQLGVQDYDRQGPLSVGSLQDIVSILSLHGYERGLTFAEARILANNSVQWASSVIETERRIQVQPGIREFLLQCKEHQLKLAVVTADDTAPAVNQLAWLNLEGNFDAVIGNDRVAKGKPYADMVHLACEQLGLSPEEVVVIGDTNGDMMMAKAAGVKASIAYLSDASLSPDDYPAADVCIRHYNDLALLTSKH